MHEALARGAEVQGYYLNGDEDTVRALVAGLLENRGRYGYMACPCRLATGDIKRDRDIICPCSYRDPDLKEYGACYCALYVSKDVREGTAPLRCIPDRRPCAF